MHGMINPSKLQTLYEIVLIQGHFNFTNNKRL
jgi:hypothetical protein